jgi:hypothetical protein
MNSRKPTCGPGLLSGVVRLEYLRCPPSELTKPTPATSTPNAAPALERPQVDGLPSVRRVLFYFLALGTYRRETLPSAVLPFP